MDDSETEDDTLERKTKEPNILEVMRELARKGVPIFTDDYEALVREIFRAQHHMARAQVTNARLAFPYQITSPINIDWLVEADDFGVGDEIMHDVNTSYHRGDNTNNYVSTVSVHDDPHHCFPRLRDDEILVNRDLLRRFCPEEKKLCDPAFDIVRWYNDILSVYRLY